MSFSAKISIFTDSLLEIEANLIQFIHGGVVDGFLSGGRVSCRVGGDV